MYICLKSYFIIKPRLKRFWFCLCEYFFQKEPGWCLCLCVFTAFVWIYQIYFLWVLWRAFMALIDWYLYLLSRFRGDREINLLFGPAVHLWRRNSLQLLHPLEVQEKNLQAHAPSLTAALKLAERCVRDQEASLLSKLEVASANFENIITKASKMEHMLTGIPMDHFPLTSHNANVRILFRKWGLGGQLLHLNALRLWWNSYSVLLFGM